MKKLLLFPTLVVTALSCFAQSATETTNPAGPVFQIAGPDKTLTDAWINYDVIKEKEKYEFVYQENPSKFIDRKSYEASVDQLDKLLDEQKNAGDVMSQQMATELGNYVHMLHEVHTVIRSNDMYRNFVFKANRRILDVSDSRMWRREVLSMNIVESLYEVAGYINETVTNDRHYYAATNPAVEQSRCEFSIKADPEYLKNNDTTFEVYVINSVYNPFTFLHYKRDANLAGMLPDYKQHKLESAALKDYFKKQMATAGKYNRASEIKRVQFDSRGVAVVDPNLAVGNGWFVYAFKGDNLYSIVPCSPCGGEPLYIPFK